MKKVVLTICLFSLMMVVVGCGSKMTSDDNLPNIFYDDLTKNEINLGRYHLIVPHPPGMKESNFWAFDLGDTDGDGITDVLIQWKNKKDYVTAFIKNRIPKNAEPNDLIWADDYIVLGQKRVGGVLGADLHGDEKEDIVIWWVEKRGVGIALQQYTGG